MDRAAAGQRRRARRGARGAARAAAAGGAVRGRPPARRSAHLRGGDYDDLAQQSADDALVAILRKLGDFRGESRFTTWAYKFALYEAAAKVRKRAWQGREIPLEAETWPLIVDDSARRPASSRERASCSGRCGEAIESELSPHQREVLVAIALNDVPIDVLAERLNTTRGALYKTLHDARQKLRAALARAAWVIDGRRSRHERTDPSATRDACSRA